MILSPGIDIRKIGSVEIVWIWIEIIVNVHSIDVVALHHIHEDFVGLILGRAVSRVHPEIFAVFLD